MTSAELVDNDRQVPSKQKTNPAVAFRQTATNIASNLLRQWVGEERAREATGRIAAALSASAASARDPSDFYACTPQSVATCVALSALTGIMPGVGSSALAYVIPQRARKDERPQLQYMLSHRGLNALARRCGQTMIAIPVSNDDKVKHDEVTGEVRLVERDIDNPPTKYEELRGVMLTVKELSGPVVCSEWVPKKLIDQRRNMSRSASSKYSPWSTWPVEMSMKTAMHYAIGRGWCVIDDTSAARALTADVEGDLPTPVLEQEAGDEAPRMSRTERAAQLAHHEDEHVEPAAEEPPPDSHEEQVKQADDLFGGGGEQEQAPVTDEFSLDPFEGEKSMDYEARLRDLIEDAEDQPRLADIQEAVKSSTLLKPVQKKKLQQEIDDRAMEV